MTSKFAIRYVSGQFIRYAFVGIMMNFLGYVLYVAATSLGMPPKFAMSLIYLCGVLLNFTISKTWVFRHNGKWSMALVAYGMVYFAGYILNYALLWALVDELGWSHLIVQALAILLVAGFLFLSLKIFVFRHSEKAV